MALNILQSPEPLSPESLLRPEEVRLIHSDAYRQLNAELERYCRGEISGRSILLAGHRGSGKTTLVQGAFLNVWRQSHESGHLRPLLVMLHGPSLLPMELPTEPRPEDRTSSQSTTASVENTEPPEEHGVVPPAQPTKSPAASGAAGQAAKNAKASKHDGNENDGTQENEGEEGGTEKKPVSGTQIALEQITVGLYRALATEVARAYRDEALSRHRREQAYFEQPRRRFWNTLPFRRGRFGTPLTVEMAGQLELELFQQPDPARLRQYWVAANVEQEGVILHGVSGPRGVDQGWRELVAVVSANQAYLRCIGKLTQSEQQTGTDSRKRNAELTWNAAGDNLVRPVLTLMSGGLVGAGAFQETGSLLQSGLAALAAALGAAGVFKLTSSVKRERTRTTTFNFVPDTSVATLDRVLPILVDRLNAAGLAPVFVVDELDKVWHLSQRMTRLVHDLKKFVAENAFFCWLTDRTYFEEVEGRIKKLSYARESTYFTYRWFIGYSPDDLHEYLGKVLELSPEPQEPKEPEAKGATAQATPEPSNEEVRYRSELRNWAKAHGKWSEEEIDREVWPYVLLHWSQMHPIDLQRELAEIRSPAGQVWWQEGRVRAYRVDVLLQLAIESVLDQGDLRPWFRRDPDKRRFVYDALYYMSRRWWDGAEVVDLTDGGLKAFDDYLVERLRTEAEDRQAKAPLQDGAEPPLTLEQLLNRVLRAEDRQFLFRVQRDVAFLLASHRLLRRSLRSWNALRREDGRELISDVVLQMVPSGRSNEGMPLKRERDGKAGTRRKFRWCFYPSGAELEPRLKQPPPARPVVPSAGDSLAPPLGWTEDLRAIRAVSDMLKRISS